MKLRYIAVADFRKSEATNVAIIAKTQKLNLGPDDVVLFVSKKGNQLVFVHGFATVDDQFLRGHAKVDVRMLESHRLRIEHGTWNPLRLVNYAQSRGIKIDGLRRFEQYYTKLSTSESSLH